MNQTAYRKRREALIPEAERHANQVAGPQPKPATADPGWPDRWNQAFHGEMDRLSREAGLI